MSTKPEAEEHDESDTSNEAGDKQSKAKELDLSATQIVGGALAAMTAAALGSQLSVAGTVVGAALASIIAAVAGSLYTASLRRTRDKVKTVFWTRQPNEVEEPTVMEIVEDREGHVAGQRSHLVAPEPIDPSPRRRNAELEAGDGRGPGRLRHRGSLADRVRAGHRSTPFQGARAPRFSRSVRAAPTRSRTARRSHRRRSRRRSRRPLRVRRLPPSRAKLPPPSPQKRRPHRHPRPSHYDGTGNDSQQSIASVRDQAQLMTIPTSRAANRQTVPRR